MTWLAGQRLTAQRLIDNTPHTVSYTALTSNVVNSTSPGTETVAVTSGNVTFETGRAYRLKLKTLVQSNAGTLGDQITVRIRKTNVSGAVWVEAPRVLANVSSGSTPCYFENICSNTTGSDITAPLALSFVRTAGGGTTIAIAATSGVHVTYIEVQDIGLAADFPSATALT